MAHRLFSPAGRIFAARLLYCHALRALRQRPSQSRARSLLAIGCNLADARCVLVGDWGVATRHPTA
eukprot:491282-Pleurochrysis_carterae.AAC.3